MSATIRRRHQVMVISKKTRSRNSSQLQLKWRVFDKTVNEIREAFAAVPADELQSAIDEALASVRNDKRERKVRTRK